MNSLKAELIDFIGGQKQQEWGGVFHSTDPGSEEGRKLSDREVIQP